MSPLRLGLPEDKAVWILRFTLPEAGLCLPSDSRSLREHYVSLLCLLKDAALFLLRIGLSEEELCLTSDWCKIHWNGGQREVWVADGQM